MQNYKKYQRGYFLPPVPSNEWVKKDYIEKAPIWCSVDLRDGNQALIEPMSLDEKIEFYKMLLEIGFKEIEVGFPAASDTEYQFLRTLIENDMIPQDVTIQVLTQAREHIIRKTFEAIKGAPNVVVHLYNSTSVAQREQVFKKSKEEIMKIAVDGAKLLEELAQGEEGNITFEYSPESFHGTEVDYALDVCNAVLDVWQPRPDRKIIVNIPATVETAMPHVFASQIEYISKNIKYRDNVVLSIHPHNDRGCGVADAELGVLAGADRVEGTLFGNGERTGNVDLVTVAMNMYAYGVNPELDFSNMPSIEARYERLTRMKVHERQPYGGSLVFTAFSGSHQDAIAKGMAYREAQERDLGRTYDSDVIRINSQSGKGGVNYILKQSHGISLPDKMREEMSYTAKRVSDQAHQELTPEWIYQIFCDNYINVDKKFHITECHFVQEDGIQAKATVESEGRTAVINGQGNGRLDAVSNAIRSYLDVDYELVDYEQHSLTKGSSSKAVSYVSITKDGQNFWGVGIDEDIIKSSYQALEVAVNKILD